MKVEDRQHELTTLQRAVDSQLDRTKAIEETANQLEQYSRRSCVRIFGIKETDGESTDTIVCDLANKKMDVPLSTSDIDRSHRVGKRVPNSVHPRPIIVKFVSYRTRTTFIKARRKLKGSKITVQEDLTAKNQEIYRKTYKSAKVESAWTVDGRVFALVNTTGGKKMKKLITSIHDVERL